MDLHLLTLGKTGAGKSATGNSILGHKAFVSSASMTSVTFRSKKDVAENSDKRKVYIVDTPGIADTGYSVDEGRQMFMTAIFEAISMSPYGYNALLLVYRFGDRFTREMIDSLQYLKQQFGEDFIKKYTIVVISGGDNFASDEGERMTFTEWCQQQTGGFRDLMDEVQGRVVLFDNSKRCKKVFQKLQRSQLLEMVEKLTEAGGKYTNEHFRQAQDAQTKVLEDKRMLLLSDEIRDETSLILTQFEKIESKKDEYGVTDQIGCFKELEERLLSHKGKISAEKNKNELLLQTECIIDKAHERLIQKIDHLSAQRAREEEEKKKQEEASRRTEELETHVREAQEEATRKRMEELFSLERKKIELEDNRRRLEEHLEQKRKKIELEDNRRRLEEHLEQKRKKIELEDNRRRLEEHLEQKRKKIELEDNRRRLEEHLEQKRKKIELEDNRRRLEEHLEQKRKKAQDALKDAEKQTEELKRQFQQARDQSNGTLYGDVYGLVKTGLSGLYSWWKG